MRYAYLIYIKKSEINVKDTVINVFLIVFSVPFSSRFACLFYPFFFLVFSLPSSVTSSTSPSSSYLSGLPSLASRFSLNKINNLYHGTSTFTHRQYRRPCLSSAYPRRGSTKNTSLASSVLSIWWSPQLSAVLIGINVSQPRNIFSSYFLNTV